MKEPITSLEPTLGFLSFHSDKLFGQICDDRLNQGLPLYPWDHHGLIACQMSSIWSAVFYIACERK